MKTRIIAMIMAPVLALAADTFYSGPKLQYRINSYYGHICGDDSIAGVAIDNEKDVTLIDCGLDGIVEGTMSQVLYHESREEMTETDPSLPAMYDSRFAEIKNSVISETIPVCEKKLGDKTYVMSRNADRLPIGTLPENSCVLVGPRNKVFDMFYLSASVNDHVLEIWIPENHPRIGAVGIDLQRLRNTLQSTYGLLKEP